MTFYFYLFFSIFFFLIRSKFLSFLSIFSIFLGCLSFLLRLSLAQTKLGSDTTYGTSHPDLSDIAVPEYGHARQHRLTLRGHEANPGPQTVLSLILILSKVFPQKLDRVSPVSGHRGKPVIPCAVIKHRRQDIHFILNALKHCRGLNINNKDPLAQRKLYLSFLMQRELNTSHFYFITNSSTN